jgi:hypothetical protein
LFSFVSALLIFVLRLLLFPMCVRSLHVADTCRQRQKWRRPLWIWFVVIKEQTEVPVLRPGYSCLAAKILKKKLHPNEEIKVFSYN